MPTPPVEPPRLAVLLSGSGRTLVNLAAAIAAGALRARIGLVIASKVCPGCDRARELGVEPVVIAGTIPADRLAAMLAEHRVDLVVLAGYLKMLAVPPGWAGRIVNIHPSLLPDFGGKGMYGHHVHEAVLAAGRTESGCTVHLVDEHYDRGPILAQARVPVLPGDTPDTLAARVFEAECRTYPVAIQARLDLLAPRQR